MVLHRLDPGSGFNIYIITVMVEKDSHPRPLAVGRNPCHLHPQSRQADHSRRPFLYQFPILELHSRTTPTHGIQIKVIVSFPNRIPILK